MERERVSCNSDDIDKYFDYLKHVIRDVQAAFVVNIDESGFQDYSDAKETVVIVPASYPGDSMVIPVDRSIKRASLMGGIALDGRTLKPALVLGRKTVEREVYKHGYTPDNVLFLYQENGFFTTELFEEYVDQVLLPYFRNRRQELRYEGVAIVKKPFS